MTLENTVVAGNFSGPDNLPSDVGSSTEEVWSGSNNLIGIGDVSVSGIENDQNGNLVGISDPIDVGFELLANNGGPTRTHAIAPSSPAANAGDNVIALTAGLLDDQRGPGYDRLRGSRVDIGAFEVQGILVTTEKDGADAAPGETTLRQAIEQATDGDLITFAKHLDGKTIELTALSDLVIDKSLTIDAGHLDQGVTIRAYDPDRLREDMPYQEYNANGGRVFLIEGRDTEVTLVGLTVTGGDSWEGGGGIRALGKSLTLVDVEVSHNAAPRPAAFEILGDTGFVDYPRDDPQNFAPICGEFQEGATGGGIFSTGDLTIIDSHFVNNATNNAGQQLSGDQLKCYNEDGQPRNVTLSETGEIFSGDIYTMGNLIVTGSRFETRPVAKVDVESDDPDAVVVGLPTDDITLGLGGIYSTNLQIGRPITVTITDTVFDTTRGLAVDAIYSGDEPEPLGVPRGGIARYELSEVLGGFFSLPDDNSTPDVDESLEPILHFAPEQLEQVTYHHDGGDDAPSFRLRMVYDDGGTSEWLPVLGSLNQTGEPEGTGLLDIDPGDTFKLEGATFLLRELNERNVVVINDVTIADAIGPMVLDRVTKAPGYEDDDEDVYDASASINLFRVNASIKNLTVNHGSGVAVALGASKATIDDSRFLPPSTLDVRKGTTAVAIRHTDTKITDTVFQGLGGSAVTTDLASTVELVQSTIFNLNGSGAAAISATGTVELLTQADKNLGRVFRDAIKGSLLVKDTVISGVLDASALSVSSGVTYSEPTELPCEEDPECDPDDPTQHEPTHGSVRDVLPYRVTIDGSTISNNRTYYGAGHLASGAWQGAGLNLRGPLDVYITDSLVADNRMLGTPGPQSSDLPITDLRVLAEEDWDLDYDLQHSGGGAGGILAHSIRSLRIENSTIADNQAAIMGGGLFVVNTDRLELLNTTVTGNEAGFQGGGVVVVGGPLVHDLNDSTEFVPVDDQAAVFVNSIIAGNKAWDFDQFETSSDSFPLLTHVSQDDSGIFAIHSENTHDVWFSAPNQALIDNGFVPATFHSLSVQSANNVIGVGVDPQLTTGGADPLLPIQDGSGVGVNGNVVGVLTHANPADPFEGAIDPQLTPRGDYGGPNGVYAIRYVDAEGDGVWDSPALDAGFWNAPQGKPDDELIRPVTVDSSSYRYDTSPAYNLVSEPPTLRDTDVLLSPLSQDDIDADVDGAKWVSGVPDLEKYRLPAPQLTFGFNDVRELDRLVLWAVSGQTDNTTDPNTTNTSQSTRLRLSYSEDGEDWTELGDYTPNWATTPGGAVTLMLDGGAYVSARYVRLEFPDYTQGDRYALREVRFGGARQSDQRGTWIDPDTGEEHYFDRKVGAVDIGAYEAPAEYETLPALPDPALIGVTVQDLTGIDLAVSSAEDSVDLDLQPGALSLREAILLANLHSGSQSIAVSGSFEDGRLTLKRGDLSVSDSMTLTGLGDTRTVLDASGSYRALPPSEGPAADGLTDPTGVYRDHYTDHNLALPGNRGVLGSRILVINDDSADLIDVELENLSLTGGLVQGSGGAIYSEENLTIIGSELHGNAAHQLYYDRLDPTGVNNGEPSGQGVFARAFPRAIAPRGGAVFSRGGDLTIDGSTISANSADVAGGGIHHEDGALLIHNGTLISKNLARRHLSFYGSLVTGSANYDNFNNLSWIPAYNARGGGVSIHGGTATISETRISDNVALTADEVYEKAFGEVGIDGASRLVHNDSRGGGLYVQEATVTVASTEISGNEAYHGGGVYVRGSSAFDIVWYSEVDEPAETTFVNTTINQNHGRVHLVTSDEFKTPKGAGLAAEGEADVILRHSTVTENVLHGGPGVEVEADGGTGIYFPDGGDNDHRGKLTIDHTVVADNRGQVTFDIYDPHRINRRTDARNGFPDGSMHTQASDVYFKHNGSTSTRTDAEDLRLALKIDHSFIGNNHLIYSGDGPAYTDDGGYHQSWYVDPNDDTVDLPWHEGGVPKRDQWGNVIGGYALGVGTHNADPTNQTTDYETHYYAGVLRPHLDLLADNGSGRQTQAPLSSGLEHVAVIHVPAAVDYTGAAAVPGLEPDRVMADPVVGFDERVGDNGKFTAAAGATPMTLPYLGNELILRQEILRESWQTISPGGTTSDFFAGLSAEAFPQFVFDLPVAAELSSLVVWSAISSVFDDGNGNEARTFQVEFYRDGDWQRDDTETLTRESLPIERGLSEVLDLSKPVVAEKVRVTITDNFFGVDVDGDVATGGDRVALGQLRFIGELLDPLADSDASNDSDPYPNRTNLLIDAGNSAAVPGVDDTPLYDQRGDGFSRVSGVIDIGAHESNVFDNTSSPSLVLLNLPPKIDEGVQPDGLKVADLRIGNLANVPWKYEISGDNIDLFYVPTDDQGRLLRELWIKPGAEVDFESLYDSDDGTASLSVSVKVTDPSRPAGLDESSAVSLTPIPVVNVNDLPTLDADPPAITLASDVTATTNPGVSVQALLARASDDDVDPVNELGMAIVGVGDAEAPNSTIEYSFDSGATWFLTPALEADEVFLLPREALVRFNKQDDFTGTIEDVIRFRVWDRTKGAVAEIAKVAGVADSLSLPTDDQAWTRAVDVVVTPQVGNPIEVAATATDGTAAVVAVDPRGVGLHVWQTASGLQAQRVASNGALLGEPIEVTDNASAVNPHVVATPDGGLIVVWEQSGDLYTRRFDLDAGLLVAAEPAAQLDPSITVASGGLSAVAHVPADDSFVVAWESSNLGAFGRHRFVGGLPTTELAAVNLPSTSGVQSHVAAAVSGDGLAIYLAWTAEGSVYRATHDSGPFVGAELTPPSGPTIPDGAQIDTVAITDVQVAIGENGDPVYGWVESIDWDIDGVASGVSTAVYYGAADSVELIGSAEERTPDGGDPVGSRINGLTLAADRGGRVGVAWTEADSSQTDSSLLRTRWYVDEQTPPTYTQVVDGVWSNPRLAASGPGEFNLTATREAGAPDAVVSQRFKLSSLNQAAWDFDGERFEVRAGADLTDPLVVSTATYGGVEYLTVNDDLTTTAVADVEQIDVVTGAADDTVDLTGLAASAGLSAELKVNVSTGAGGDTIYVGSGEVTVDGGAGDDKYYLANDVATTLTIVDEAGADRLVLDEWDNDKALIVLGFAGVQTISPDGAAAEIRLNLTGGDEIEHIGDLTDGTETPDTTAHTIFKPIDKPEELVVDGSLSLTEALLWAKTDAKADVITFDGAITALQLSDQLLIDTAVTIDGGGNVTLDASGNNRIFKVAEGVGATLRDITLTNGSADTGGAIYSAGDLTLSDVEITSSDATAGDGGAVASIGGRLTVSGGLISGNSASGDGGGVAFDGEELLVLGGSMTGNEAGGSGGALAIKGGVARITSSAVEQNQASQGAGLYVDGGEVTIKRSGLVANGVGQAVAPDGGGLYVGSDAGLDIANTTFSGNEGATGGAIHNATSGGSLGLTNVTIAFNRADSGAGLYSSGEQVTAVKTLFFGNTDSTFNLTTI